MENKNCSPALEFKNLTVLKSNGKKVLDSISITINHGENIAILGPNGAGKSSFIKVITHEFYPLYDKDTIFKVFGKEDWNIFDLRYLLGIVTNDLQHVYMNETSGHDVILSGYFGSIGLYEQDKITSQMKKKTEEVLELLEIENLKNNKINEMSYGEAKRFLIGRALIHSPKVLILDEPTNSLDMRAANKFREIMRKIARSGASIILVTHNIHDIIPEITRVAAMRDGRFIADGKKEEIITGKIISELFDISSGIENRAGYYYVYN